MAHRGQPVHRERREPSARLARPVLKVSSDSPALRAKLESTASASSTEIPGEQRFLTPSMTWSPKPGKATSRSPPTLESTRLTTSPHPAEIGPSWLPQAQPEHKDQLEHRARPAQQAHKVGLERTVFPDRKGKLDQPVRPEPRAQPARADPKERQGP